MRPQQVRSGSRSRSSLDYASPLGRRRYARDERPLAFRSLRARGRLGAGLAVGFGAGLAVGFGAELAVGFGAEARGRLRGRARGRLRGRARSPRPPDRHRCRSVPAHRARRLRRPRRVRRGGDGTRERCGHLLRELAGIHGSCELSRTFRNALGVAEEDERDRWGAVAAGETVRERQRLAPLAGRGDERERGRRLGDHGERVGRVRREHRLVPGAHEHALHGRYLGDVVVDEEDARHGARLWIAPSRGPSGRPPVRVR